MCMKKASFVLICLLFIFVINIYNALALESIGEFQFNLLESNLDRIMNSYDAVVVLYSGDKKGEIEKEFIKSAKLYETPVGFYLLTDESQALKFRTHFNCMNTNMGIGKYAAVGVVTKDGIRKCKIFEINNIHHMKNLMSEVAVNYGNMCKLNLVLNAIEARSKADSKYEYEKIFVGIIDFITPNLSRSVCN